MKSDLKAKLKKWNDDKYGYNKIGAVEESVVNKDELEITIEDLEETYSYRFNIPMTPTNIEVMKQQLREAGVGINGETDDRGRLNLGVRNSNEEKQVIVLD